MATVPPSATQEHSSADDTVAVSVPRTSKGSTIATFPIPQELRDHVYSYLLLGDNVSQVGHKDNRVYQFHTNILAVNKKVNQEASKYLFTKNTFVIVSHKWDGLDRFLKSTGVPIVADHSTSKLKQHSIRIHLSGKVPPNHTQPKLDLQSFIMHFDHLPRLVLSLQWLQYTVKGPYLFVTSAAGTPITTTTSTTATIHKPPITKIQLRSTEHRQITPALQHELLEPFKSLIGGAQKVVLLNTADEEHAIPLRKGMSPTLVWPSAYRWSEYETILSIKQVMDELADSGRLETAYRNYGKVAHLALNYQDRDVVPPIDSDSAAVLRQHEYLGIDCGVSAGFIALRLAGTLSNTPDLATMWMSRARNALYDTISAKGAGNAGDWHHLDHLFVLSKLFPFDRSGGLQRPNLDEALEDFQLAAEEWPADRYLAHDLALIERLVGEPWTPETIYEAVKASSACMLDIRRFETATKANALERPKRLVGWQDIEHLKQLSEADKETINVSLKLAVK